MRAEVAFLANLKLGNEADDDHNDAVNKNFDFYEVANAQVCRPRTDMAATISVTGSPTDSRCSVASRILVTTLPCFIVYRFTLERLFCPVVKCVTHANTGDACRR